MLWKLPLSRHRAHGLTCCRLDPVANDPRRTFSSVSTTTATLRRTGARVAKEGGSASYAADQTSEDLPEVAAEPRTEQVVLLLDVRLIEELDAHINGELSRVVGNDARKLLLGAPSAIVFL